MNFSRRDTILAATSLGFASVLPSRTLATTSLGSGLLSTISDGHLVLPGDFLFDPMPQDELARLLDEFGLSRARLEPECNLALYQDGEMNVLFDVGAGPDFMPSVGAVYGSLDEIGLSPSDITHVVFTHAHPDHIWGLLDEFDDLLFPDARYMMGRAEWDYWWDPETVDSIGIARAAFAVGARRRMEAIENQVELFDDGQEILPGIAAMASYGHTPGHMSFELQNGSETAMVVGDAIGNHHVAFARPDWPSGADQDMVKGAETRQRLLQRLAQEQMVLVGFHLPGGGMGRTEKITHGYRFIGGDL
ncbi:MAG: MBL fold metallo-hydrolase [Pseudomonadota bacterium]